MIDLTTKFAGLSLKSPLVVSSSGLTYSVERIKKMAAAGAGAGPTLGLDVPVQQPGWDRALGERIQWLVGQRLQGARIQLNPAHLGPMEVRIQVQQDQANIQFSSAHSVVREALEAALPRLRELLTVLREIDSVVKAQPFPETELMQ